MILPLGPRLNRREALQFLHERHPRHVERVDDDEEVPPEVLGYELFLLQGRICDILMAGRTRGVRRVFETVERLIDRGDLDVLRDVNGHFLHPELVVRPDPAHARALMPPQLAHLYDAARRRLQRTHFR